MFPALGQKIIRQGKELVEEANVINVSDDSEIPRIFKENLKVEPSLKSVSSIFKNDRYRAKVNYAPYFQRNYVWDDIKATYFIESILIGTEIPPLVLFEDSGRLEVIDGRQRYETILRFIQDDFVLRGEGLKRVTRLKGKKYSTLSVADRDIFDDAKIRLLIFSVVNEPSMTDGQKDKVKREIFSRYNSGITALKPIEIERALYSNDMITLYLESKLLGNADLLECCEKLFVAPSRRSGALRDRVNHITSRIRFVLSMPYIPIYSYAYAKRKSDVVHDCYMLKIAGCDPQTIFGDVLGLLEWLDVFQNLVKNSVCLSGNRFVNEVASWAYLITLHENGSALDAERYADMLLRADTNAELWKTIPVQYRSLEESFKQTESHYDKAIRSRYGVAAFCAQSITGLNFSCYLDDKEQYKSMFLKEKNSRQLCDIRLTKPDPHSESIDDILENVRKNKFRIRPDYQRSEVKDIAKASSLIESILLGIRLPPIFVFRREDGIIEVVDGQQRLLTIIGFLGRSYIDENGEEQYSVKNKFKLTNIRVLTDLKGMRAETIKREKPEYYDKLLDFNVDIIEIDQSQNKDFDPLDLFVRLNQKPCPIEPNSFEMWNSYINRAIADRAKEIVRLHPGTLFRSVDLRMKNEDLVTTLAYADYVAKANKNDATAAFDLFVRNGRIAVRVESKSNITKTLFKASDEDLDGFVASLDEVDAFLRKLEILANGHFENLKAMFLSEKSRRRSMPNQEVYLLWIMLSKARLDDLSNDDEGHAIDELRRLVVESREGISCSDVAVFLKNAAISIETAASPS